MHNPFAETTSPPRISPSSLRPDRSGAMRTGLIPIVLLGLVGGVAAQTCTVSDASGDYDLSPLQRTGTSARTSHGAEICCRGRLQGAQGRGRVLLSQVSPAPATAACADCSCSFCAPSTLTSELRARR